MKTDWTRFTTEQEAVKWLREKRAEDGKLISAEQAKKELRKLVPLEKAYQKKIMDYLRARPGVFAWKQSNGRYSSQNGTPDITCVFHGRYVGFEVKRPIFGEVSAIQKDAIRRIREVGGVAAVVTTPEDAADVLHKIEKEVKRK